MRKVQKIAIKSAKVADIVLTVLFALIAPLLLFRMQFFYFKNCCFVQDASCNRRKAESDRVSGKSGDGFGFR